MTLHRETPEGFVPWNGEPVDGVVYPRSIETLWSREELDDIGLYDPEDLYEVPEGYRVVSRTLARVNGEVVWAYVVEPIPAPVPSDYVLTDRQLRLGLIGAGVLPSTVRASIAAAITDDLEREAMLTWFDYTRDVQWDHPVTQQLMAIAGFTPETASTMWLAAAGIEA